MRPVSALDGTRLLVALAVVVWPAAVGAQQTVRYEPGERITKFSLRDGRRRSPR